MDWVENIVDKVFDKMSQEKILMKQPDPNMPKEMVDNTIPVDDDWLGWKPIKSILDDSDLDQIEEMIGIKLPMSYRKLLKYKHFYELDIDDHAVNFNSHLPDKSLQGFKELYFDFYDPKYIIKRGYIHFAEFEDYGLLCFDSNKKSLDNEYPIVFIDHDDLTKTHFYANNLKELMHADEDRGNRFIIDLNAYYSKQR